MSPKSKKRYWKKKQIGKQTSRNNDNDLETNANNVIPKLSESQVTAEKDSRPRKIRLLEIIQKIAEQMQLDCREPLLLLLDNLLTIPSYDSEKKEVIIQIIINVCNQLKNYDADELKALEKQLLSKFLPRELRTLIVDENSLETFFPFSIMGSCHFGILNVGYLKMPDGSRSKVVIKESENTRYDELLIEEAKIMSRLDHKNVLKILAFEKKGPRFATEYMTLGNLRDALEEYTFSESKLVDILREVTSGMEYIAAKDYVHRDLRCKTILLSSNGECKISEFGLCRYVGDTGGIYEDKEIQIDGLYLAPEIRETRKFTSKSDVWMLGLLGWEIYFISRSVNDPLVDSHRQLKRGYLMVFRAVGMLQNRGCPWLLWKYLSEFPLNKDPQKRPTFTEIRQWLDDHNDLSEE